MPFDIPGMAKPPLEKDAIHIERPSLCIASTQPGVTIHAGDPRFLPSVRKIYSRSENDAAEKLIRLKTVLKASKTDLFWSKLMDGLTELTGAQFGFVAKRILVDDQDSAVEMPPIGEPGSCLMAVAWYYNDGHDTVGLHRDIQYKAHDCPCAHMKHDKVFIITDRLNEFITANPNKIPFAAEAYIGVPLFYEGKCFAHFGVMWTEEGLARKDLSWAYVEMILHSLEDLLIDRLISGQSFVKKPSQTMTPPETAAVIPQEVITAQQSLKPYAKSLSHELRTPMHGVVGMLDIMHASVQEQVEGQPSAKLRGVFQSLRDNIETVQDSAKRAVEAADNVVHAYDMNMQIPDTPLQDTESPAGAHHNNNTYFDYKPSKVIEGNNIHFNSHKRRRSTDQDWQFGPPNKIRQIEEPRHVSPRSKSPVTRAQRSSPPTVRTPESLAAPTLREVSLATPNSEIEGFPTPGLRQTSIRQLLPVVINDALRVGGRPDSAVTQPTDLGEKIEVRTRSSNGHTSQKDIEWSVEPQVPESFLVDERDLAKLIYEVFLNAFKFTTEGKVTLRVKLSNSLKYLVIEVCDQGDGIPVDFQPLLFKPFSREDSSTTRSREGLGLGLMVARGLARRLGGDVSLARSELEGPNQGSDFEIRVPLEPGSAQSRSGTPVNTTTEPTRSIMRGTGSRTPKSPNSIFNLNSMGRKFQETKSTSPLRPRTSGKESLLEDGSVPAVKRPLPAVSKDGYDKGLAAKHPLTFLVAEDNKINRKLLVNMLGKLGYDDVYEAFDGREAVRVMHEIRQSHRQHCKRRISESGRTRSIERTDRAKPKKPVDVVLMDLWMPEMDGYQATEEIMRMYRPGSPVETNVNTATDGMPDRSSHGGGEPALALPTILAVSADVTEQAIERATRTGMEGFMTKPYRIRDLEKLILEFCVP